MIVFARKTDEGIVICFGGEEIIVTVVSIRGDKVRLGIEAPIEVPVHRGEVQQLLSQNWRDEEALHTGKSCNVWLTERQLRWLDQAAKELQFDAQPASRQMLIEAVLDAIASVDFDCRGIASLDDLKILLSEALRAGSRP